MNDRSHPRPRAAAPRRAHGRPRTGWAWRRRLRTLGLVAAAAAAGGAVYGMIVTHDVAEGLLRGMTAGLLIAVPLAAFELFYVETRRGEAFRRLPLGAALAIKTVVYIAVILLGLELARLVVPIDDEGGHRTAFEFLRNTVFSLAFSVVALFVLQVRRIMGPGVLGSFLIGRYHRPREETRVFLFLDLVGSTALAERVAGPRFLDLLNRLYLDITEPIAEHGGEIHKYVGDAVIVTWAGGAGFAGASSVRCVFAIEDRLRALAGQYERAFGHVPRFRGALHVGPVVSGEIGDVKQEIAFLGDGMNTTARLVDLCRQRGRDIVASAALLERTTLPEGIEAEPLGDITLRGKSEAMPVFALVRG